MYKFYSYKFDKVLNYFYFFLCFTLFIFKIKYFDADLFFDDSSVGGPWSIEAFSIELIKSDIIVQNYSGVWHALTWDDMNGNKWILEVGFKNYFENNRYWSKYLQFSDENAALTE